MADIPTTSSLQTFPLSPKPLQKESETLEENMTTQEDHVNLDKLFTKINYNNEMIKLYQIDQLNSQDVNHKELIEKKIQHLIQDRNSLINYLNQLYDKNTEKLDLTYKINTNDKYIKDIQSKEIKINNQKINELNNEKMNKDRQYELALYQIEEKNTKNKYLFWGIISIIIIIIIYSLHTFGLFNNFVTISLISIVFICFIFYLIIQLSINNNRNKRYYDKYNFPSPPPIPQQEEVCVEEQIKVMVKNEEECVIKHEEEAKIIKKDECLNIPTLSESQLQEANNPLANKLDL